jgi:hypothetical protein
MAESNLDEPLVILCRVGQYQHAALIRQTLESEGIPSITDGENAAALWGIGVSDLTQMKILVRQSDRPRAAEILKTLETEVGQEIDVIEEE